MKVVILSDNKPGHYKQSLGIIQNLPECNTEWIEIRFKNKWRDNVLRVIMCLFGWIRFPSSLSHSILKCCLDSKTYKSVFLIQEADLILSTGSSVAAVNLLLGKLLNAKTVTCLRPSPIGTRYFDLAVIPTLNWERSKARHNICKTIGIPNPISPEILNAEREILENALKLKDQKRIGLLIGGSDKHETITMTDARKLYDICWNIVTNQNAQILLTTSRRTPTEVTDFFRTKLESEDWCPLFVDPDTPSELNDPYQAILALSDVLIVSADSFSMVCEAASSGRKVHVIELTHKTGRLPKRYKAYKYMEEHSIITLNTLQTLQENLSDSDVFQKSLIHLQDAETAVNAIRTMTRII